MKELVLALPCKLRISSALFIFVISLNLINHRTAAKLTCLSLLNRMRLKGSKKSFALFILKSHSHDAPIC